MDKKDKDFIIQLLKNAIAILEEDKKEPITNWTTNSNLRNIIVEKARSYIGKCPYVYGGKDIKTGIDCSGFTQFIYLDSGVNGIPGTWANSKDQRLWGKTVYKLGDARPGDLICYEGHVAIYIGNGKIIDAGKSSIGISERSVNIMPIVTIRNVIGD